MLPQQKQMLLGQLVVPGPVLLLTAPPESVTVRSRLS